MLSVYVEYKILLAWKVTATTTMKTTDLMFGSSILTAIQLFSALNIYIIWIEFYMNFQFAAHISSELPMAEFLTWLVTGIRLFDLQI